MADKPKEPVSPDQQAVQEQVQALGLTEDPTPPTPGEPTPPPTPSAPAATPATPAATAPPATPTAPAAPTITEKELKDLRDKAGWADRSQAALDSARSTTTTLQAENERLRKALGVTTVPTVDQTPEQLAADLAAVKWFDKTASDRIAQLPEEVLSKHPAFMKRDQMIYGLHDQLEQTRFLMRFPADQQPVVQERVLPILQQQRIASGWQKNYSTLWEEYREGVKAQAAVVGLAVQPTTPPPSPTPQPTPPAPVHVPPSLAGISASGPEVPRQPVQMTPEEARIFGLA